MKQYTATVWNFSFSWDEKLSTKIKISYMQNVIHHICPFQIECNSQWCRKIFVIQSRKSIGNIANTSASMYFSFRKRMLNIMHAMLRHKCIVYNTLYRKNGLSHSIVHVKKQKDAYHFFFICKTYSNARYSMFVVCSSQVIFYFYTLFWGQEK